MTAYLTCPQFEALVYLWLHDRAGILGELYRHRSECDQCKENFIYVQLDMRNRLEAARRLSEQQPGRTGIDALPVEAAPAIVPALPQVV